jgi:hypothetical protein
MGKAKLHNAQTEVAAGTKKYMLDGIAKVCEHYKRRKPGSKAELDAQAFFKQELAKYTDETALEEFSLHPEAFMGFIPVAALFILAGVACFWFGGTWLPAAILGSLLPALAVAMFLFEFLFYRNFVDFLFPKKTSANVYGVKKAAGETQRCIIFGGHTDAAYEWTYSYIGEVVALGIVIFGAVASMFLVLGANIAKLAGVLGGTFPRLTGSWKVWGIILLITVPFALLIMKFINYKVVTDGANDNLTANYIALALVKEMTESDARFEHTDVAVLLSGSEEAGLRGAKAFAKRHREELSDPAVETVFVALDTMRENEELRVCNFGCTGTQRNDKAVGDLLHAAAARCGAEIPDTELYPGALDSEAFSMQGLRATGLTAVSHDAKRYYHTRDDHAGNLDPACLGLSLNICKAAARLFDETGMAPYDAARARKKN